MIQLVHSSIDGTLPNQLAVNVDNSSAYSRYWTRCPLTQSTGRLQLLHSVDNDTINQ